MLANGAASERVDAERESEAWYEERAGKAEREGVGAMREQELVFFRKREATELHLDLKAYSRARTRPLRAQEGTWVDGGV